MGVKSRERDAFGQADKIEPKVDAQTTLKMNSSPSAGSVQPTEGEPEGYEFGGPLGALLIIIASPLIMW